VFFIVYRQIFPAQNKFVAIVALGEGWHNYHHVFPWDYKTAELGDYGYNFTTAFIDFFAWLGWAYDLKVASPELVRKRALRTGDGSHEVASWGTVGGEVIPAVEDDEFDEYGEKIKQE
jgi:stearoyl-CoA desaturase (delta-9 desaturase)